ncbi:hypothetical protein DE146DRAFT_757987 [Phaeosphaeria sp. MPI-PUGE-AT-0046c]|nr:hypothetical protein DE146DRAFT_757987 [Phaeosphaeria sp. MPI-PUGE-AT-0046c]
MSTLYGHTKVEPVPASTINRVSLEARRDVMFYLTYLNAVVSKHESKLGFFAAKLHGSVWQFTPSKLDLKRIIQFHKLHPDGEVPLALTRRYGDRLIGLL